MLIKKQASQLTSVDSPRGGYGVIHKCDYLREELKVRSLKAFSYVELEKNTKIGAHEHINEYEFYLIVEGNGVVLDNGKEFPVSSGDLLITGHQDNHGIYTSGESTLKMVAMILTKDGA